MPPFLCQSTWATEFFRVLPKFGTSHRLFCDNVWWERHSNSLSTLTLQIKWGAPTLVRARQSAVRWKSKHFFLFFSRSCHCYVSFHQPDWWAVALRRSSCAWWLDPDASCGISTHTVIHNASARKQKRQQKWVAGLGDDAFVCCLKGFKSVVTFLSQISPLWG